MRRALSVLRGGWGIIGGSANRARTPSCRGRRLAVEVVGSIETECSFCEEEKYHSRLVANTSHEH